MSPWLMQNPLRQKDMERWLWLNSLSSAEQSVHCDAGRMKRIQILETLLSSIVLSCRLMGIPPQS